MLVPEDLRYAETHEWVKLEGEVATVGITDHAQAELTDIVYVELPAVGTKISPKQPTAVVESVKAASDIYAPISGEVTETNSALEGSPGLVNTDPYGNGWLFKLHASNPGELADLKDAVAYKAQIGD
ncbi:MAG: glycine cleavage system protein GcvH [Verrucomicrobia bacterium]|nr:glycine cleavage system protein GcvH [Verrucomicrobiota bacterium]